MSIHIVTLNSENTIQQTGWVLKVRKRAEFVSGVLLIIFITDKSASSVCKMLREQRTKHSQTIKDIHFIAIAHKSC